MGTSRQAYYQGRQRNAARGQRAEVVVKLVNEQRLRQPRLPFIDGQCVIADQDGSQQRKRAPEGAQCLFAWCGEKSTRLAATRDEANHAQTCQQHGVAFDFRHGGD